MGWLPVGGERLVPNFSPIPNHQFPIPNFNMLDLLHFAVTWALVGLIWTIQLVKYPGFRYVADEVFVEYHGHHTRAILFLVAPLMLSELALAGWLAWENVWAWDKVVPLCMVLGLWLSTVALQIPAHEILAKGKNAPAIDRLVNSNWIRTVVWTAKGIWLLFFL